MEPIPKVYVTEGGFGIAVIDTHPQLPDLFMEYLIEKCWKEFKNQKLDFDQIKAFCHTEIVTAMYYEKLWECPYRKKWTWWSPCYGTH